MHNLNGYFLYREHFPWGRCEGWRNKEGELLFKLDGLTLNKKELYEYLLDVWVPQAEIDVSFKLNSLKQFLG